MQGDFSSGCEVLAEYLRIKKKLDFLKKYTYIPSIQHAIDEMLSWLKKYQDEALDTEIIVIAMILNPWQRLKFIQDFYPHASDLANDLILEIFEERLIDWKSKVSSEDPIVQVSTLPSAVDKCDMFAAELDKNAPSSQHNHELTDYLSGNFGILPEEKPLDWWRVSLFNLSFYHMMDGQCHWSFIFPLSFVRNTRSCYQYLLWWHGTICPYLQQLAVVSACFLQPQMFWRRDKGQFYPIQSLVRWGAESGSSVEL